MFAKSLRIMYFVTTFLDTLATARGYTRDANGVETWSGPLMPKSFVEWRERRFEERIAAETERKEREAAAAKAEAERKERWQNIARTDNSLMDRYETLERLTPKGGTLAIIHRYYDSYCSEWQYVMREDGSLIRTRGQDGATVEFESMGDLLSDYSGYRHHGFELSYSD